MVPGQDIEQAAEILRTGGLVAFPTETVYGLGADATNAAAVGRIFEVKGRPTSHPLIVHVGVAADLRQWATDIPAVAWKLAERFWPGPLTLVLKKHARVPHGVTGGLETVGIRVPNHPLALELLREFGGGVAAPSANRFGSVSPTTAQHVSADIGSLIDFVLDGGPCDVGVESTIVNLTGAEPEILRPGGVTREALESVLERPVAVREGGPVRVPGQLPSHYAPKAEVVLAEPHEVAGRAMQLCRQGLRVGVITSHQGVTVAGADTIVVSGSDVEIARRLYAALREFDQRGCDIVLATLPVETGIGLAIADRLRRAAGPRAKGLA